MCMDVDLLLASFFTHHHLFNVYQDAFRAEQSASPTYYPTLSPTFWPTYYPTLSPIDQNDSDESETIAPTEAVEMSMGVDSVSFSSQKGYLSIIIIRVLTYSISKKDANTSEGNVMTFLSSGLSMSMGFDWDADGAIETVSAASN